MNWKRLIIAWIAVFIAFQVMDYVVHTLILGPTYMAMTDVWRSDMMDKMWMFIPMGIIITFLFVYIFVKGYENKGRMEGLRYGLIIGLFMNIPAAFSSHVLYPIEMGLAVKWFVFGMVEFIIAGIILAAIYKPKA